MSRTWKLERLAPSLASVAIVASAPFMGQLRGALQAALPSGAYRTVVGVAVLGAVGVATAVGLWRIRERRVARYAALGLALAIGVLYARWTASGNLGVDLVERVHFVEYGVLALLFFRAWRDRGDLSTLAAPLLACTIVACFDEGLQWFVPGRVGEIRDVGLDAVAACCGLLFALGLDPPAHVMWRLPRRPAVGLAALAAAALLTAAAFIGAIHLGHEIVFESSTLRSRYTADELDAMSRDRASRWSREAPVVLRRLSREDQYLAEGVWHVQRRNEAAGAGEALAAWRENLILERFFAPVLDWPSYAAPAPPRWPAEQRENAGTQVAADQSPYVSRAEPFPIFIWSRLLFWLVVGAVVLVVAWMWIGGTRGRESGVLSCR